MTAQFPDVMIYKEQNYSIAGISTGEELFNPLKHGVQSTGTCSACWRGYIATFSVCDSHLKVIKAKVYLDEAMVQAGTAPKLFGKSAVLPEDNGLGMSCYSNLDLPIPYTGGILVGTNFIRSMYVHMGFHPAYKYKTVHELIFDTGKLIKASDKSAAMEKIRDDLSGRPLEPTSTSRDEIKKWIEQCFSQKYRL